VKEARSGTHYPARSASDMVLLSYKMYNTSGSKTGPF